MRIGALLLAVLAGGCIEAQLQVCGDLVCAPDSVCLPDNTCASRESVDACTGLVEDAPCQTAFYDGSCIGGVCAAPRCGDGRVGGSEACDGVVTGIDCVEFGFDTGVPTCTDRCDIDVINSCTRFGWRRILSEPIEAMWSNGTNGIAFIHTDGRDVEVRWDGVAFFDDDVWDELVGTATVVYAVRTDRIIQSTGGAWEERPSPGITTYVRGAVVTDDGTLYLAVGDTCAIKKLPPGGAWLDIDAGAGQCNNGSASGNAILIAYDDGNIRKYNGTSWSTLFNAGDPVSTVLELDGYVFYGLTGIDGWFIREEGVTYTMHANRCVQLVRAGSYVFSHDGDGGYRRLDGTELIERFSAPTFGEMYADPMGNFYVYGNGINILTDFAYADHEGVDGITLDMAMTREGLPVVSTMTEVYAINTNDYWDDLAIGAGMDALAGLYTDELYVSDGEQVHFFDGGGLTDITPPAFAGGLKDLWVPGEGTPLDAYAVGDNALIMSFEFGDGWTMHTPPPGSTGCNLAELASAPDDDSTLYAVGSCAGVGVVWKQTGSTTWSEIYRGGPALVAVTVASDGEIFAAGPLGGARTRNGVWGDLPEAQGISISATTSSDVWCAGGPDEVVRWDGTHWSRVAVSGAIKPRVIATPTAVYFGGTSQSVLLR